MRTTPNGRPDRRYSPQLYAYRKKTKALRGTVAANGEPCWLCGKPIDLDLPATHPMSFTADHVQSIATGGRMLGELRPCHRSCNSRRGKGRVRENIDKPTTTRQW